MPIDISLIEAPPCEFILNGSALILPPLRFLTMKRAWAVFKAHPYISNVLGYTTLFASADLIQQSVLGRKHTAGSLSEDAGGVDWRRTARVATVGFCFHANFNYHWLRWLERMLPGARARAVMGKVAVDQMIAAPLTISAFYIGWCFCLGLKTCEKMESAVIFLNASFPISQFFSFSVPSIFFIFF